MPVSFRASVRTDQQSDVEEAARLLLAPTSLLDPASRTMLSIRSLCRKAPKVAASAE
jgi:hypothetical protein